MKPSGVVVEEEGDMPLVAVVEEEEEEEDMQPVEVEVEVMVMVVGGNNKDKLKEFSLEEAYFVWCDYKK